MAQQSHDGMQSKNGITGQPRGFADAGMWDADF